MSKLKESLDFTSPREAARPFTPKLSALSESPLYDKVWEDSDLSKRDRSLITVAALVCLGRMDEFPAHLHRAIGNGVTETELAAVITHLAFYAGFPAAISASAVANRILR
jgi:4-carboxymuconolactone decarboxylase